MKPSEREREREDCGHHDVISNGSGCSTPPPLPPELQRLLYCTPTDVMCKVFSQLNCGHDDVISDGGGCSTPPPPPPPPALRPPTDIMCKVFSQLDCDDLLSCSLVCKYSLSLSSDLFFQAMVQRLLGAERGMEERIHGLREASGLKLHTHTMTQLYSAFLTHLLP
ncbi:F-box/SPRY domain-containing protein 1-like isoform X2 [Carex littledalei]|uniref:F-box/SPRY domain-containing protein 1-like isoform X2 n=1 Tax=Carex littledalei TaxID=544730 RepID=A0A833VLP5_9POAL|nr:F-box/SPRY domain-containing protein 1-like isoform X2 [Carex littledalei]